MGDTTQILSQIEHGDPTAAKGILPFVNDELRKLAALPDETLLLPGHNYGHVPNATLGETKAQNAYLKVKDLETWKTIMGG